MKIVVVFCTIAVVALSVNATVFFKEQFLDGGKINCNVHEVVVDRGW